jgi:hypothetical protein
MKPDFIGIGFQKSGTSWLFNQLRSHPEFWLPYRKEFHYFDRNIKYPSPNFFAQKHFIPRLFNAHFRKLLRRDVVNPLKNKDYDRALWSLKFYCYTINDKWYLSQFNKTEKLTGEYTPSYSILDIEDIQKIYKLLPNVKLITLIRDPIERAWSAYRFYNHGKPIDFESCIAFFDSPLQESRNSYSQSLSNYKSIFPKNHLFLGFYDALVEQPKTLINGVVKFIGAKSDLLNKKKLYTRINKSPEQEMPIEIYNHLKHKYFIEIKTLSESFSGYCNRWYLNHYSTETQSNSMNPNPAYIIL